MCIRDRSYTAQVRGTLTDQSGAVVANATVTITNDGTNIAQTTHTDDHGEYFFTGLRPAVYVLKAQAQGFRAAEKTNVVLQVDQQTSVNFLLHPLSVSQTMEVTETAPLLDTDNATLGTDITSEYVKEIPLLNRDFFGLTFLAAGVTEVTGSGTQDNLSLIHISVPAELAQIPEPKAAAKPKSAKPAEEKK